MYRSLGTAGLGITGRQSEIIELALSFGFKGIDLDLDEFQQQVVVHGLAHARRLIDSARLKLSTFRLPVVWDEDEATLESARPRLAELLALAQQVGLSRAVTTVAPANDLRPYHENFELHRRRLAELGSLCGSHGVRLGLEFVATADARAGRAFQFIHTFDALATLGSMVGSEAVGLVVDVWQIHAAGQSLDEVKKLPKEKIVAVYLSDAPADIPAGELTPAQRLLPGETGGIDLAAWLVALAELGYDGPLIPMAHPDATAGMGREQIVRTAGERLEAVWKAAGLTPGGKLTVARQS
jgi:sugar phosphate isomerase/epimerase